MKKKLVLVIVLVIVLVLFTGLAGFAFDNLRGALDQKRGKTPWASPTPHLGQFDPADYSVQELQEQLNQREDLVVLDVRSKAEYNQGHLPGAVQADYYNVEELKKVIGNKTPVIYCTFSTWRAPYAAYQLYKQGYDDVGVLTGGITAWQKKFDNLVTTQGEAGIVAEKPAAPFPQRQAVAAEEKEVVEIDVVARTFEFVPNKIEVRKGQRVILNITSLDVGHGFALPEFAINESIPAGETKRVEFLADQEGVFPFVCSIYCGIDHTSMVGELVVE